MKRSTFNAIGGWQPLLFCVGMYVVALFFSIFVCSSIFYVVNSKPATKSVEKAAVASTVKIQQLAAVN